MRLLYAGIRDEHVRRAIPAGPRGSVRSSRARRQSVPVHRLSSHPRCDAVAGSGAGGRISCSFVAICAALGIGRSANGRLAILASGDAGGVFHDSRRGPGGAHCRGRNRRGRRIESAGQAMEPHRQPGGDRRTARVLGDGGPRSDRRRADVERNRRALDRCAGCFPRVAGPVCLETDPKPRHAGRKSGDRLGDRRRRSAAARARCVCAFVQRGRTAHGAAAVVLHGIPADGARARAS